MKTVYEGTGSFSFAFGAGNLCPSMYIYYPPLNLSTLKSPKIIHSLKIPKRSPLVLKNPKKISKNKKFFQIKSIFAYNLKSKKWQLTNH